MLHVRPDDLPPRPPICAQKVLLRDWWVSVYGDPLPTTPFGRLAVFKDGVGTLNPVLRSGFVGIVWRPLDLFEWYDRQYVKRFVAHDIGGHLVPDVVLASVHQLYSNIDTQPATLAELRFVEPEGDAL